MKAIRWIAAGALIASAQVWGAELVVTNGGFEESTTPMYSPAEFWVGNNAWAGHTAHPKPNNGTLGAKFGYYTPTDVGGVWMGHGLLDDTYKTGMTYNFRSWAVGGGNNLGLATYEMGYLTNEPNDFNSFVQLDRTQYSLNGVTQWEPYDGAWHTVRAGAPEIGRRIMIRFGVCNSDDVWVDSAQVIETNIALADLPATPTNLTPAPGAVDVATNVTLTATGFAGAGSFAASQWQLSRDASFLRPLFETGITGPVTDVALPAGALSVNNRYFWRVKHKNAAGLWSSWSAVTYFDTEKTNVPLGVLANGGFEESTTPMYGLADHWVGNNAWAGHTAHPKPNNGTLGAKFGYYTPWDLGGVWMGHELLDSMYEAGKSYTFSAWFVGGGDEKGMAIFEMGYLADANDYESFISLDRTEYSLDYVPEWRWYAGAFHTVASGAPEVGKRIMVRFGKSQKSNDVWLDEAHVAATNYGAGELPDAPQTIWPTNGAQNVSLTPTLQGSAYQTGSGSPHGASIWQISSNPNFLMPEYTSFVQSNALTQITLTEDDTLANNMTYYWRVKYCDAAGRWSAWSTPAAFNTPFRYLRNGGFENNPGSVSGINPPAEWGPGPTNGASWAPHTAFPRPGNSGLGVNFAYYNPYPVDSHILVQTTSLVFTEGEIYQFSSYAYPGINDSGTVCYALGYILDPFDPSSFQWVATASTNITGRTSWQWYPGVIHEVTNGAPEIGEPIVVGFINQDWIDMGDIWVDEALLEIVPEPAGALGLLAALGMLRRKR